MRILTMQPLINFNLLQHKNSLTVAILYILHLKIFKVLVNAIRPTSKLVNNSKQIKLPALLVCKQHHPQWGCKTWDPALSWTLSSHILQLTARDICPPLWHHKWIIVSLSNKLKISYDLAYQSNCEDINKHAINTYN